MSVLGFRREKIEMALRDLIFLPFSAVKNKVIAEKSER